MKSLWKYAGISVLCFALGMGFAHWNIASHCDSEEDATFIGGHKYFCADYDSFAAWLAAHMSNGQQRKQWGA